MQEIDKLTPVYIVDDDESVRESLQFMLESYQFSITAYESGKAFLAEADLNNIGCVVLDSRMPEMIGEEVHKILKERNSLLSVIYLTGHAIFQWRLMHSITVR